MEPLHIGFAEAIFKVIEERIPFGIGKALTTLASILIVLVAIVFCFQFLLAAIANVVAGPSLSRITGAWLSPSERSKLASAISAIVFFTLGWLMMNIPRYFPPKARRDSDLERRIAALERIVKQP
jgi:hypothetical protein